MKRLFYFVLGIMVFCLPVSCFAYTKTETVFSNLKSTGEVKDTSVSIQLSQITEGDIIDYSYLTNIKNTNGKEKFSIESEKITWKSTGKDIYYKGIMNDQLPVSVNAKYYLNGEEKTIKQMKKKKGHVEIHLHFENHKYDTETSLYVPFVVSVGTTLSTENQSNFSISNGKVIENGNRAFLVGVSAPGLYHNLGIDDFKNLDDIVISYDTKKFSLQDIYIVSTPKLLEEVDLSKLNQVASLNESLQSLQSGMDQIEEGSSSLREGMTYYTSQMGVFRDALKQAEEGASQLDDGAALLNSTLEPYYQMIIHYGNVLKNEATEDDINAVDPLFLEKYQKLQNILQENQELLVVAEEKVREFSDMYHANSLDQFSDTDALMDYYFEQGLDTREILKLAVCKEVYEENIKVMEYLEQNNYDVIQGFITLINDIEGKATELYGGTSQISEGLKTLHSGLSLIYEKSALLENGAVQLADGTNQLSAGISKINQEGIQKISEYGNKGVELANKIKQMQTLSKNYSGFSSYNIDRTIFVSKLSK